MFHELDDPTPPPLDAGLRQQVRSRVRARRRRRTAIGGVAGVAVLGVGGLYARALQPLDQMRTLELEIADRVPSAGADGPTTVLVLGTDGAGPAGERAASPRVDSAMVVRTDPSRQANRLLSIPRDLQVTASDGEVTRLSELYAREGAEGVLRAVEQLGIPVDHVVIVDFVGFRDAVDALGGIDVAVEAPLRDEASGLAVDAPGCVHLDGAQALALVRARHLESYVDGAWVADPSGDLGRMQRQRTLVSAARAQIGVPDPATLHELTSAVAGGLTVDAGLDRSTMVSILQDVLTGRLDAALLPTDPSTAEDGSVRSVTNVDTPVLVTWLNSELDSANAGPPSTRVGDEGTVVPDPVLGICR